MVARGCPPWCFSAGAGCMSALDEKNTKDGTPGGGQNPACWGCRVGLAPPSESLRGLSRVRETVGRARRRVRSAVRGFPGRRPSGPAGHQRVRPPSLVRPMGQRPNRNPSGFGCDHDLKHGGHGEPRRGHGDIAVSTRAPRFIEGRAPIWIAMGLSSIRGLPVGLRDLCVSIA